MRTWARKLSKFRQQVGIRKKNWVNNLVNIELIVSVLFINLYASWDAWWWVTLFYYTFFVIGITDVPHMNIVEGFPFLFTAFSFYIYFNIHIWVGFFFSSIYYYTDYMAYD